jgi:hypothetical protein
MVFRQPPLVERRYFEAVDESNLALLQCLLGAVDCRLCGENFACGSKYVYSLAADFKVLVVSLEVFCPFDDGVLSYNGRLQPLSVKVANIRLEMFTKLLCAPAQGVRKLPLSWLRPLLSFSNTLLVLRFLGIVWHTQRYSQCLLILLVFIEFGIE